MDNQEDVRRLIPSQLLLLPGDPREVAESIGLDWWAALKLHDDGWLSFNPAEQQLTDDGMEAEFLFLGSLVAAGCDPPMLRKLLAGLTKPYQYRRESIYYDWGAKRWRELPVIPEPDPEGQAREWIDQLKENGDVEGLRSLLEDIEEAMKGLSSE